MTLEKKAFENGLEKEENADDHHFTFSCSVFLFFNPLADDKILDWSELRQIAVNILKYI